MAAAIGRSDPAGAQEVMRSSKPVSTPRRIVRQQVPESILNDANLKVAMSVFPSNYNLEIPKTIWRVKQAGAKRVALQFPEGLLMYSLAICDILEVFADVEECFVLGDVTYGACCVDDYSAVALGAEFLVHYGHSCLVPVDVTQIPCLYVFVDIQIDVSHLVEAIKQNFKASSRIAVAGTIQFSTAISAAKAALAVDFPHLVVPQAKPLSPGEVLGCTAPTLPAKTVDDLIFVSDGRFHLEAFMIANPTVKAFRYDPYSRVLSYEEYDHRGMRNARRKAVEQARNGKQWGIVLGTLGRQGNPRILAHVQQRLDARCISYVVFLISEMSPSKIAAFEDSVDVWVQIACPRLSIDWGEAFPTPLLTPYEAEVALGFVDPWWIADETLITGRIGKECVGSTAQTSNKSCCGKAGEKGCGCISCRHEGGPLGQYPMDYYAREGGPWNSHYTQKPASTRVVERKDGHNVLVAPRRPSC